MQFKIVSLFSLLATTAVGFTIPENQGDGAFAVSFDENGNAQIEKLGELSTTKARREPPAVGHIVPKSVSAKLDRRDQSGCTQHDFSGSQGDYTVAQQCMKDFFAEGVLVAKHKIFYCNSGAVFLALCNYSNSMDQGGFPYEVDNFNAVIDGQCGAWKGGWNLFSGPNKTLWRDTQGTAICTNINN